MFGAVLTQNQLHYHKVNSESTFWAQNQLRVNYLGATNLQIKQLMGFLVRLNDNHKHQESKSFNNSLICLRKKVLVCLSSAISLIHIWVCLQDMSGKLTLSWLCEFSKVVTSLREARKDTDFIVNGSQEDAGEWPRKNEAKEAIWRSGANMCSNVGHFEFVKVLRASAILKNWRCGRRQWQMEMTSRKHRWWRVISSVVERNLFWAH